MAFAAGALSKVLIGQTTAQLSSAVATGGTGPYTYQWYRSTVSGFTPGAGNLISGATSLSLADSGLLPATTYYYEVIATDTGNSNVTVDSTQLAVLTQASQGQNQFAQTTILGLIDMRVGPTNVLAAQVDVSASAPLFPGQAVKCVANTSGGIPKVVAVTSKSDQVIGFVKYNIKDVQYVVGQNLEIALLGTVIWLYATAAVTQFTEVCVDPTYIGGVQPTGNAAVFVGWALDGSAGAGPVRVMLMQNIAFATA